MSKVPTPAKLLNQVLKAIKEELPKKNAKNMTTMTTPPNTTSSDSNLAIISPFAMEVEMNSCVDKRLLDSFSRFTRSAATQMGMAISSGPDTLPPIYDKWTVLSSPFVHKTARTQFERRDHRQRMKIEGIWNEEIRGKFVWYLNKHVPNEVELSIKLIDRISK